MPLIIAQNKDEVISELCKLMETVSKDSISTKGNFSIGFSGGSLASFLAKGLPSISSDFDKWIIYFCDERVVPESDPESTFGLYKKKLLDSGILNLNPQQFISIKQGVLAEEAATDYVTKMQQHFPNTSLPRIDMLLLGMGPDGHTCSLFPGHKLLNESSKWIAAITDSPKPPPSRITMTFPVINNARYCVFAASGKEKADMIKRILVDKEDLPAGKVKPIAGKLFWIMDKEAGIHINNIDIC